MLPPFFGLWGELGLDETTFSCTILKKEGKSIKTFLFLFGVLLPCLVITISYSCIYIAVRRQRQKLKLHKTLTITTSEDHRFREDNRLTLMMLTIFLAFLLCFLPLMLANVVDNEKKTHYPWLHILSSVMAWASSVVNPFIYAASNRNYRVAYHKIFTTLKFWGDPLSPMASKSYQASKNSKDFSNVKKGTAIYNAV